MLSYQLPVTSYQVTSSRRHRALGGKTLGNEYLNASQHPARLPTPGKTGFLGGKTLGNEYLNGSQHPATEESGGTGEAKLHYQVFKKLCKNPLVFTC